MYLFPCLYKVLQLLAFTLNELVFHTFTTAHASNCLHFRKRFLRLPASLYSLLQLLFLLQMKDFGRVFAVVSVWVCSIFCPLCGLHVNTQTVVEKKLSNNSNNNTDSVAAQFYWFREQFHRQYDTNDEFNMRFLHFRVRRRRMAMM